MSRRVRPALIAAAIALVAVARFGAAPPNAAPKGGDHWAFKAPVRPALPSVRDAAWCRTPVDYFVLERLAREGLKPSPEADRVTLLRRLHLDFTGLPPTPAEVNAFLKDQDPLAYERAVDRLLESPHYGERWGRHWLDAARYADTDGYEKDKLRWIYFYRDWVIGAFNRDLPYDRFVIEQLAGDLLPNAPQDQIVATGFLRNSMLNEEGGVDPEQFRMDAMFDRMDALGKSVLGLTIQCCQCHNHKFDPFTQEDYYRLFAFLNNDHEGSRVVYSADELRAAAELTRKIRAIETGLKEAMPDLDTRMSAWEATARRQQVDWHVLELEHQGDNGQRYFPRKDGSLVAQGYAPTKHTPTFRVRTDLKQVRSFRLELLTDPDLPAGGPGRSFRGLCALTEFRVELTDPKQPAKKQKLKIARATADFGNAEAELEPIFDDRSKRRRVSGPIEYAIDGKDETAWGIDAGPGHRNVDRNAVFILERPVTIPDGGYLTVFLVQNHGGWNSDDNQNMNLGRFRLSAAGVEAEADPIPKRVRDIFAVPSRERSQAQRDEVFSYFRTTIPEWKEANEQIEDLWRQWPAGDTTLTLTRRVEPRDTHVLNRGDFLKPLERVQPGVPKFLHPLPEKHDGDRFALARWLVDRRSPTTARAFVNRVWQAYFGTGLVATPEDFGTQGQKPSHPELLDWLAVEFMEPTHGRPWSIKNLHRLIVNSATYRQSSRVTPELLERDPYNRLLARQSRLRVEGEVVRDIALSASGLLNPKVGGPGVFAPAPAFLFQPPASYGPFNWIEASGKDRYRRAIYTFRRRSTPYPALANFDVPNGDVSCVRRTRSNTPLQALTTLNESVFTDCARALAARALMEGGSTDADRLAYGFRLCVARTPTADELAELAKLLSSQRKRLAANELDPAEVGTGQRDPQRAGDPNLLEQAAYTLVARVLLNLDETITRE